MIKILDKTKLLLLIMLSVILSGCTYVYFPFFRNYSHKPVELVFEISNYYKQGNHSFKYTQQILPISKKTYKHLKDSLQVVMLSPDTASLTIPANSTVLLSKWGTYANKLILKQENNIDSIYIRGNDTLNKHFLHKGYGFPVSYLYYYDYK